ncbi:MAG: hypothetical protein GOU98_01555 [Candidatus Altiarchaeota archaeon]|nr:hypothetical protein [Candidatus Altiarchaeota archaeon]
MLLCSYCNYRASLHASHFNKSFCKPHLEKYLLRKLRRNLNHFKLINPNDELEFVDDGSPISTAEFYLLKKATKKWPIVFRKSAKKKISSSTVEDETTKIMDGLFNKKAVTSSFVEKNTIKPFRDFVSKELFTLGYLLGNTKESKNFNITPTGFEEVGSKLNLLRAWDQIQEALGHQHDTVNKVKE